MVRYLVMALAAVLAPLFALVPSLVLAQSAGVDFKGKTVTMIIGFAAGGGTDASGRMIAPFLVKYLPGQPNVVVQNIPGADGLTALNYFVQQVKPDGLTITMASGSGADPIQYRKPEAKYDPSKFAVVGGVGRGGSVLVISKEAEARLTVKGVPPVIMGSPGGIPRSGIQMTAWGIEYLGWNAKWVTGYKGTRDLMIALERGEIEMVATSSMSEVKRMLESGKAKMYAQAGSLTDGKFIARSDIPDVAVFQTMMAGKISKPLEAKAFEYWAALAAMDKWLALPPNVPAPVVEAYRAAYVAMGKDAEFIERGRKLSEDFEVQSVADVEHIVKTLAGIPLDAMGHMNTMLKKQGIGID